MESQVERITKALSDGNWHCTSEFYADFMADPRRRMKDIQERGFSLESRPCKSHTYHAGGSKEWRMATVAKTATPRLVYDPINDRMVRV